MKHVCSRAVRFILLPLLIVSLISVCEVHAKKKGGDSGGGGESSSGGNGGGGSGGGKSGGGAAMDVMIIGANGQIMNG